MAEPADLFQLADARLPELIRTASCEAGTDELGVEELALALMGVGILAPERLAENAVWDGANGARSGRNAIGAALAAVPRADKIRIEQVVTHGRAGTVSGRVTRGTETRLFCHVIRFTSAAAREIAQIVSFEHAVRRSEGA